MTFKEWKSRCTACDWTGMLLAWDHALESLTCPTCNAPAVLNYGQPQLSAGIITDDFPGGVEIRHAICNPDGTPKRYYSKTEIKRALNEAGYNWADDTPGPYKVQWSGVRKERPRPEPIRPARARE